MEMKLKKEEILPLKNEIETTLREKLLPFWLDRCKDEENGGFITHFDRDGRDTGEDEKSLIAQSRTVYTMASAHRAGYGEGIAHMLFAAKRNADITVIVHDNGVYALTTGQRSPTSEAGFVGPSTPHGNEEDPFNPLALLLEAGATFVARGYSARIEELSGIIVAAVEHEGFSLVEVLQPSVTFTNYYEEYEAKVKPVEAPAASLEEALKLARVKDQLFSGILYRVERPSHGARLHGDRNPVANHPDRDDRLERVRSLLDR